MTTTFQLTIDCADPARMVSFWATALGCDVQPPPAGFQSWNAYWRSVGVSEAELDDAQDAADSLVDPQGCGEDLVPAGARSQGRQEPPAPRSPGERGGRGVPLARRRTRVDAEVERLVTAGATPVRTLQSDGLDHYAVTLQDPEGNELCVN